MRRREVDVNLVPHIPRAPARGQTSEDDGAPTLPRRGVQWKCVKSVSFANGDSTL